MGGYKNSITDIDGKVGIGASSPANKMHIQSSSADQLRIERTGVGFWNFNTYASGDFVIDNGSERMRIDSSGNVGIGAVSNASRLLISKDNTTGNALEISNSGSSRSLDINHNADGTGTVDDIVRISNNGSRKFTIDSSGRVGIGTSSPTTAKLVVNGDSNTFGVRIDGNTTSGQSYGLRVRAGSNSSDTALLVEDTSSSPLLSIKGNGDVFFGTTGTPNGTSVYGSAFIDGGSGLRQLLQASSTTSAVSVQRFYNPNGNVGSIQTSGSSTSYVTSSDYRLKENVVEMTGALDRVDALKPSRFNFIADPNKTVDGFLAHEVAEVVPEAISGEKDAMEEYEVTPAEYETVIIQEAVEATYDEEGNELTPAQEAITEQRLVAEAVMGTRPVYQGIDQSKLVPLLVGAIQELRAELQALKANNSLS